MASVQLTKRTDKLPLFWENAACEILISSMRCLTSKNLPVLWNNRPILNPFWLLTYYCMMQAVLTLLAMCCLASGLTETTETPVLWVWTLSDSTAEHESRLRFYLESLTFWHKTELGELSSGESKNMPHLFIWFFIVLVYIFYHSHSLPSA